MVGVYIISMAVLLLCSSCQKAPVEEEGHPDVGLPILLIGKLHRGTLPGVEGCLLGGTATIWINGNPVQAVRDSRVLYIGPFCNSGPNRIAVRGTATQSCDIAVYQEFVHRPHRLEAMDVLLPRVETQPEQALSVQLSLPFESPLFQSSPVADDSRQAAHAYVRQALAEIHSLFEAGQWDLAAARMLEGTQIYRKLLGWTQEELEEKEKELASEYAAHAGRIEFAPEDQLQLAIGGNVVLVYACQSNGNLRDVISTAESHASPLSTLAHQIQFARIDNRWLVWAFND